MRVTSTMTNTRYMGNTQQATAMRDHYFQRVLTGEKFSRASEDPVGAARAFRLRSQMSMNSDYLRAASDMDGRLKTSESAVTSLGERISSILQEDINGALNGTNDKFSREIYAKNIRATMSALVTSMNTSDGEQYLFGGAEYNTPPFTVKEGQLYYRGVNVDTGKTNAYIQMGDSRLRFDDDTTSQSVLSEGYKISLEQAAAGAASEIVVDPATKKITISMKEGSTGEDLQALLKKTGTSAGGGIDFSKVSVDGNLSDKPPLGAAGGAGVALKDQVDLDSLANETYFIDLGLGMRFDESGKIDPQSVFDASQPGIKYIGYGKNDAGLPKNLYSVLDNIAKIFEDDTLSLADQVSKADPFIEQLTNSSESLTMNITDFGNKSTLVNYVIDRSETAEISLKTLRDSIEKVDEYEAITDMNQGNLLYQTILRSGSSLIQPTIWDFMK